MFLFLSLHPSPVLNLSPFLPSSYYYSSPYSLLLSLSLSLFINTPSDFISPLSLIISFHFSPLLVLLLYFFSSHLILSVSCNFSLHPASSAHLTSTPTKETLVLILFTPSLFIPPPYFCVCLLTSPACAVHKQKKKRQNKRCLPTLFPSRFRPATLPIPSPIHPPVSFVAAFLCPGKQTTSSSTTTKANKDNNDEDPAELKHIIGTQ